jgi:hypothetical protein
LTLGELKYVDNNDKYMAKKVFDNTEKINRLNMSNSSLKRICTLAVWSSDIEDLNDLI